MFLYRQARADEVSKVAKLFHQSFNQYPFMDLLVKREKKIIHLFLKCINTDKSIF
ncbi:hypothetical protein EH2_00839 [Bacillus subtilis]|uniref:hypothetical protein n=1 Tax=Bacillus subtilis TaxID=1423 RepID=UPI000FA5149D|nr:hypothetical protein [Bacillus subtilis]NJI50841.1 hypothetical protein [Bacillus subtilis]RPK21545.1 hypothetical protein EH2_00839 [Bacillus subtilis]